jgi:hypothetical protein
VPWPVRDFQRYNKQGQRESEHNIAESFQARGLPRPPAEVFLHSDPVFLRGVPEHDCSFAAESNLPRNPNGMFFCNLQPAA